MYDEVCTQRRPVVAASVGCHYLNGAHPHPCPEDKETMKAGVKKRFAMKPPEPDAELVKQLSCFVANWLKKNLKPVASDSDTSFETWLDKTPYSLGRKQQLTDRWNKAGRTLLKKHYKVKSFMKDETYPEFKHARAINSRSDEFKCYTGPIFKLIEKELFALDWFIKKIPVSDRPSYIMEKVYKLGSKYAACDYIAFESHFTKLMLETIEFQLYEYMTSELPIGSEFMCHVKSAMSGRNKCYFKHFKVEIDATRMSGEMCTSLGNSFTNLMLFLFAAELSGMTNVRGVVEGDDGLFSGDGPFPTIEIFKKLGWSIKMEIHDNINTASFCGLIFDMDDRLNVTDPISMILSFGWTTRKYAKAGDKRMKMLLRAKALSYAYQYPMCPIINSVVRYALRMTEGVRAKLNSDANAYKAEIYRESIDFFNRHADVLYGKIPMNTRLLVEQKFGVPIENQIIIEEYFDSLKEIQPLSHPLIDLHLHKDSITYYREYVFTAPNYLRDNEFR